MSLSRRASRRVWGLVWKLLVMMVALVPVTLLLCDLVTSGGSDLPYVTTPRLRKHQYIRSGVGVDPDQLASSTGAICGANLTTCPAQLDRLMVLGLLNVTRQIRSTGETEGREGDTRKAKRLVKWHGRKYNTGLSFPTPKNITISYIAIEDHFCTALKVVFVIGDPGDERVLNDLLEDNRIYHDLLLFDFHDSYRNLSYKGVGALWWAAEYCKGPRYVAKTDDDIFLNIFALARLLNAHGWDLEAEGEREVGMSGEGEKGLDKAEGRSGDGEKGLGKAKGSGEKGLVKVREKSGKGLDKTEGKNSKGLDKSEGKSSKGLDKTEGKSSKGLDKTEGKSGEGLDKTEGKSGKGLDKTVGKNDTGNGEKGLGKAKGNGEKGLNKAKGNGEKGFDKTDGKSGKDTTEKGFENTDEKRDSGRLEETEGKTGSKVVDNAVERKEKPAAPKTNGKGGNVGKDEPGTKEQKDVVTVVSESVNKGDKSGIYKEEEKSKGTKDKIEVDTEMGDSGREKNITSTGETQSESDSQRGSPSIKQEQSNTTTNGKRDESNNGKSETASKGNGATKDKTLRLPHIHCLVWTSMPVLRNPKDKWYVNPADFPDKVFPTYCSGSAFLMNWPTARALIRASASARFLWVDDAYLTGVLVKAAGVKLVNRSSLYELTGSKFSESLIEGNRVFLHHGRFSVEELWDMVVKKEAEVPIVTEIPK